MEDMITLRAYQPGDAEAVNHLASAAFSEYATAVNDWAGLAEHAANTAALADDAELLLAEQGGRLVGCVGYICPGRPREMAFPADWAVLRMLSVLPSARGQGVGRLLTQACINRAQGDGAAILGLHTSPIFRSAINLYLRMGFQLQKALPDRGGTPCVLYALNLPDLPRNLKQVYRI